MKHVTQEVLSQCRTHNLNFHKWLSIDHCGASNADLKDEATGEK